MPKEVRINVKNANANDDREREVTNLNIEGDDTWKRGARLNKERLNAKTESEFKKYSQSLIGTP